MHMPLLVKADSVIFIIIGLAPELPEDLYMLIKKVCHSLMISGEVIIYDDAVGLGFGFQVR